MPHPCQATKIGRFLYTVAHMQTFRVGTCSFCWFPHHQRERGVWPVIFPLHSRQGWA